MRAHALFTFVLAALILSNTAYAQDAALAWDSPKMHIGLHSTLPLNQSDDGTKLGLVTHLIIPDAAALSPPLWYVGFKPQGDTWAAEVLGGMRFAPDTSSPIISARLTLKPGKLYFWTDIEYTPLFDHNVYSLTVVQANFDKALIGVETENWIFPTTGEGHASAGPSVSVFWNDHLLLGTGVLVTTEQTVFMRGYVDAVF